ncbi:hydroxyacid dehydrogenase [Beijerinckia indica]|uniref:D-isomer specific 2-hydroxyacid dehydrogenase NAD-binding n=1 Tax=Beijerinckia indica subsp. indica (strain ATCC 9039 / DSM 1715 / NCIMB 8712) TaxID=395963 RepID=B2IKB7_BEII9|nr:hydroxyacid dehydrogenase [Beijerinckia indica]ACB96398.1 D-isomer specific 2-hydroxyacid dehydrogenase NAD-binding [Beijerinckia indica subsp. indica ATCC 9039]
MTHILVAGRIHEAGLDILRNASGITLDLVDEVSTESYAPLVDRADAILIRTQPLPESVIDRAQKLKFVSRHGVGYDVVDVEALTRRNIPLAIVGDVNSRSVAEHAMMLMLAVAKRVCVYDAATRAGKWGIRNDLYATDISGKTLLLIGFGRIGRLVASMARGFDMTILAYDPFLDEAAIKAAGAIPTRDLEGALRSADFVSLHMPPPRNGALLGESELASMKPGAILINTARGGVVDEKALAKALTDGRLAGAGLDVFTQEPPPADHPLLQMDRVILTPHSAVMTRECAARMAVSASRNILDYFAGRLDPSLVVNGEVLSAPARESVSVGG